MEHVTYVFHNRGVAFRMNFSFGLILKNIETQELVYYRPYMNALIFEKPIYVSRKKDLKRVRARFNNYDIVQYMLNQRPNTKFRSVLVTNLRVWVWDLNYPILGYLRNLRSFPSNLKHLKCIQPLISKLYDRHTYYKDRKCAFRCLALHWHYEIYRIKGQKLYESKVQKYFHQWMKYREMDEKDFQGVNLCDMNLFEKCFEINVNIYERVENEFTQLKYASCGKYGETMNLNMWEQHLSYIYDLSLFATTFQCSNCFKLFYSDDALTRHEKSDCSTITSYRFKGGYYENIQTIFEALDFVGIHIQEEDRYQEDFIVFDFESILSPLNEHHTDKLTLTSRHIPVSVAMCGTLTNQSEGKFILRDNEKDLIREWIAEMRIWAQEIRDKAYKKWGWILDRLQFIMNGIRRQIGQTEEAYLYPNDMNVTLLNTEYSLSILEQDDEYKKYSLNTLSRLYDRAKTYIDEVVILSYHSSKYDVNLIKKYLPVELNMCNTNKGTVIKRNNAYNCISTGEMLFLDVTNFLAAGISYDKFLKAYEVGVSKKFFPYEYLTSFNVLYEEELPLPFSGAWYSSLKGGNVLGDNDETILTNFRVVKKAWDTYGMKNLADLLEWYNLDDVRPFCSAVRRMLSFYVTKGIDIHKNAISLSGVGRRWLFQSARKRGVTFALFDKFSKDLYRTIREGVVGGPSIIFRRHAKINETLIKNNPNRIVKEILGFDSCSMYAKAMSMEMTVGGFVRRFENNNFKPMVRDKYLLAYYWMDFIAATEKITICHKLNVGKEYRCSAYLADGVEFCSNSNNENNNNNNINNNTIFEFFGCYYHGHENCALSLSLSDEEKKLRWNRHMKKLKYLKSKYNVRYIYECEFMKKYSMDSDFHRFVQSRRPEFYQNHKGSVSMETILQAVENDQLFGMLQVDISTPTGEWPPGKERDQSPESYFHEMPPIYCTTKVPFEAIGPHMQEHAKKYNLSQKPRTLLVGGLKAKKILLASKLLQWYIKHGLVVSKIYQVVEFCRDACFSDFINEVKEARREADMNEDTKIKAMTFKLLANASFGGLLLQKCKHKNIKFIHGLNAAKNCINDRRFCSLETLCESDQIYEVENYKRRIDMNTPIQCGFMTLQYAKLIHNMFYYDFLCEFLQPGSFEMLHCDTDSAYICISAKKLDDIVKPEKKEAYMKAVYGSCDDNIKINFGENNHFITRQCCEKHNKYDQKEPGIYKEELSGIKEGIGLSSKSYILITDKKVEPSQTPLKVLLGQSLVNKARKVKTRTIYRRLQLNNTKFPCKSIKWYYKLVSKGVSKKNVINPVYTYRHVLKTQEKRSSINKGFRLWNSEIYSYSQSKDAFSYFYCKRAVNQDQVTTRPLTIEMIPVKRPLGNINHVASESGVDNVLVEG